eukprot:SAG25_NODE_12_length_28061_cov_181.931795_16_plen_5330_part_01
MFDGVDNDALAINDCNGKPFPHSWLGDGFCDCLAPHCPKGVPTKPGSVKKKGDFNCDTFRCDDGDCGKPGSCRSVRGMKAFTIKPDNGWYKGELKKMASHEFYNFQAVAGHTYWIATELITLDDTVLYLLDKNLIQIAQNDNAGRGTRASLIQWRCPKDGNYFLKVRSYNPTRMGKFNIEVRTTPANMPGSVPCLKGNHVPRSLTNCHGYNGDTCIYICLPGFMPSGRHYCNSAGAFSGGQCIAKNCTGPTKFIKHSKTICNEATGKACTYVCDPGYTPLGQHVCQANGAFSGGQCVPKLCTKGNRIKNSQTTCRGSVGDQCIFVCNPGYTAVGSHVCNTKAAFTGGMCTEVVCRKGNTLANSRTKCAGNAGSKCVYVCNPGYVPTGDHVCGLDGAFKGGGCIDQRGCALDKAGFNPCARDPKDGHKPDIHATCIDLKAPVVGHSCLCSHGYEETAAGVCANIDACKGNTCRAKGDSVALCIDTPPGQNASVGTSLSGGYSCKCSSGWEDKKGTCQAQDRCNAAKPCKNGGVCSAIGIADYMCDCVPGFSGVNCELDIDECCSHPCGHQGICTERLGGRYSCRCIGGFSGENCETNVDDCHNMPCRHGGTCVDNVGGYTCHCPSKWTGVNCDNPMIGCSPTQAKACSKNAECFIYKSNPMCRCFSGYSSTDRGKTCVDEDNCVVDLNPGKEPYCMNGGKCTDFINYAMCACPRGWTGSRCNVPASACCLQPCTHGGMCSKSCAYGPSKEWPRLDAYQCSCPQGYSGAQCKNHTDECSSQPCINGARCYDGQASYTCKCAAGFSGVNCLKDEDECASKPCKNGAKCINLPSGYECKCVGKTYGVNCDLMIAPTPGNVTCRPGFKGATCTVNIDECASKPCLYNTGACVDGVDSFHCKCQKGWGGPMCNTETDECASSPCLHGGTCSDHLDGYDCKCTFGWAGLNCEVNVDECWSLPCMAGGVCKSSGCAYTCTCPPGLNGTANCGASCASRGFKNKGGAQCTTEINECGSMPCRNGGVCRGACGKKAGYTCTCPAGVYGDNCEIDRNECASFPCLHGGACSEGRELFKCVCVSGFTGSRCETKGVKPPAPNTTLPDGTCRAGYKGAGCSIDVDECQSKPCLHGSNCADSDNSYTCSCTKGWGGANCANVIDLCASGACQNGAACTSKLNSYVCTCRAGYSGQNCNVDVDECLSKPCFNSGKCVDSTKDNNVCPDAFKCECKADFKRGDRCASNNCPCGLTGDYCEIDIDECLSNPCLNGGVCSERNLTCGLAYSCDCGNSGWTGENCAKDYDACQLQATKGYPCSNGGTCTDSAPGQRDTYGCTCVRTSGWVGNRCDKDIDECFAYANTCKHGGTCVNTPGAYTCDCNSTGVSINATGTHPWRGHHCEIDIDECSLFPCKNGPKHCEDSTDNKTAYAPTAYTIHGLKNRPYYKCTCGDGWTGHNCEVDINECSSNPCKNGAVCSDSTNDPQRVAMNKYLCTCAEGFMGEWCHLVQDFCASNPCKNGAKCIQGTQNGVVRGAYQCLCAPGYRNGMCTLTDVAKRWRAANPKGSVKDELKRKFPADCTRNSFAGGNCDVDFDECSSFPCENGGICSDSTTKARINIDRYECACQDGYANGICANHIIKQVPAYAGQCAVTGGNCNVDIDECTSKPCHYGASCKTTKDKINTYQCMCPAGVANGFCASNAPSYVKNQCSVYGGKCDIDVDECLSAPCRHGGKCTSSIPVVNSFARFQGVEPSVTETAVDSVQGYVTYRLNLKIKGDRKNIYTLYGHPDHVMRLPAAFQDSKFSADVGGVNPAYMALSKTVAFDSWLTIQEVNGDVKKSLSHAGIDFAAWTSASGITVSDGAVFRTNPDAPMDISKPITVAQLSVAKGSHWRVSMNVRGRKKTEARKLNGNTGHASGDWIAENVIFDYRMEQKGVCHDTQGFVDTLGAKCKSYGFGIGRVPCSQAAARANKAGLDASKACCVCSGGAKTIPLNVYQCVCPPGYRGHNCEINIDECASGTMQGPYKWLRATKPCKNGAKCTDGIDAYTCTCAYGWDGFNCIVQVNKCSRSEDDCAPQAVCQHTGPGRHTCTCRAGWINDADDPKALKVCTATVSKGISHPQFVINSKLCRAIKTGTACLAAKVCTFAAPKTGSKCRDVNECSKLRLNAVQEQSLTKGRCQNGATCSESSSDKSVIQDKFKCTCKPGFAGGWCPNAPAKYAAVCNRTADETCDLDIDECASKPCKNGATCIDSHSNKKDSNPLNDVAYDSYRCLCVLGYTNGFCAYKWPADQSVVRRSYTEQCNVMSGAEGGKCDVVVDPCKDSNTCANGAKCISMASSASDRTLYDGTVLSVPAGEKRCLCNRGTDGGVCNYAATPQQRSTCSKTGVVAKGRCANDLNECASNPCKNGATCRESRPDPGNRRGRLSIPLATYMCVCKPGFANGWCPFTPLAEYSAECSVAQDGDCDLDINECASSPCANKAVCVDASVSSGAVGNSGSKNKLVPDAYRCKCLSGFANGICAYTFLPDYKKQCAVATGGNCDMDVDECKSKPCKNGAVCTDSTSRGVTVPVKPILKAYRHVVPEVTAILTNPREKTTTFRASITLKTGATNCYSIFGTAAAPMDLPAAKQYKTSVDKKGNLVAFGVNVGGIDPLIWGGSQGQALDSWLTVGLTKGDNTGALGQLGIDFDAWTVKAGLKVTSGAVFWMKPDKAPGGKVTVAQLSVPTNTAWSMTLNAQGRSYQDRYTKLGEAIGDWTEYGIKFGFDTPPPPPPPLGSMCAAGTGSTCFTGVSDTCGQFKVTLDADGGQHDVWPANDRTFAWKDRTTTDILGLWKYPGKAGKVGYYPEKLPKGVNMKGTSGPWVLSYKLEFKAKGVELLEAQIDYVSGGEYHIGLPKASGTGFSSVKSNSCYDCERGQCKGVTSVRPDGTIRANHGRCLVKQSGGTLSKTWLLRAKSKHSVGTFWFSPKIKCGKVQAVLGCTDPRAMNFDHAATVDNGKCAYAPYDAFSCQCVAGYTNGICDYVNWAPYDKLCSVAQGGRCDVDLNECVSNPCTSNSTGGNGTCADSSKVTSVGINAYKCTCQYGWDGHNCDTHINECSRSEDDCDPNHATCRHIAPGVHSCTCHTGYEDNPNAPVECLATVSPGISHPQFVKNSKICEPLKGNKQKCLAAKVCTYKKARTGTVCQDINECSSKPCQNGAVCTDSNDNVKPAIPLLTYRCTCADGYTNGKCEYKFVRHVTATCGILQDANCDIDVRECYSNPCKNGAACSDSVTHTNIAPGTYSCACQRGFTNGRCAYAPCREGGTRLDTYPGGYAQVCYKGQWKYVCGHEFRKNDNGANLVCQSVGFATGTIITKTVQAPAFPAADLVAVGQCNASDTSLLKCTGGKNLLSCSGIRGCCKQDANAKGEFGGVPAGFRVMCSGRLKGFKKLTPPPPPPKGSVPTPFTKQCSANFDGTCDVDIDECWSKPCKNGAVCRQSGINGYDCVCKAGYTNGMCGYNVIREYAAQCAVSGGNCDVDVDECASKPCKNGATCTTSAPAKINQFVCKCAAGYANGICGKTRANALAPKLAKFEWGWDGFSSSTRVVPVWRRGMTTPSVKTGPVSGADGKWFIYMETSGGRTNAVSYLNVPGTYVSSTKKGTLQFSYHMYGANIGTLSVQALVGSRWTTVWSKKGQQQKNQKHPWRKQSLKLPPRTLKLRFRGQKGTSWQGDMAIDSVAINGLSYTPIWRKSLSQYGAACQVVGGVCDVDINECVSKPCRHGKCEDSSSFGISPHLFVRGHTTQVATSKYGTTFQLSLSLENEATSVYAIFGNSAEGAKLQLPPAYQAKGGSDIGGVDPRIVNAVPAMKYDSWLTIGASTNKVQLSTVGVDFTKWTNKVPLDVTNGGVFLKDPKLNVATKVGVVTVAQLTTPDGTDWKVKISAQGRLKSRVSASGSGLVGGDWKQLNVEFERHTQNLHLIEADQYRCQCNAGWANGMCSGKFPLPYSLPDALKKGESCNRAIFGNCDKAIDECASNPCKNGCRCIQNNKNSYTCAKKGVFQGKKFQIKQGWGGDNCNKPINPCARNEDNCDSNAICVHTGPGKHTCTCSAGFKGTGYKGTGTIQGQFESGSDGWTKDGAKFWTRGTTTSSKSTGATKAASGRYFYYLETSSPSKINDISYLVSPTFSSGRSMTFYYHMHGASMRSLSLQVKVKGRYSTVWTKTGQQQKKATDAWRSSSTVRLPTGTTQVRFKGTRGKSYTGDASVDNIKISWGAAKPAPGCVDIDECAQKPCKNGAVCVDSTSRPRKGDAAVLPGQFRCHCKAGFASGFCEAGKFPAQYRSVCDIEMGTCDVDIDECVSSPCKNSAVCSDSTSQGGVPSDNYLCTCPLGFVNGMCSHKVPAAYKTQCVVLGSQGGNCDVDLDECASSPCKNGAQCTESGQGRSAKSATVDSRVPFGFFSCKCLPGFANGICTFPTGAPNPALKTYLANKCGDIAAMAAGIFPSAGGTCNIDVDECVSQPCKNAAACFDSYNNKSGTFGYSVSPDAFACSCRLGFSNGACAYAYTTKPTSVNIDGKVPIGMPANSYFYKKPKGCFTTKATYEGKVCDVDVDECKGDPCKKSQGVCYDSTDATKIPKNAVKQFPKGIPVAQSWCDCAVDACLEPYSVWAGKACEKPVDACAAGPCQNQGNCTDRWCSYTCSCMKGFEGRNCQTNWDECISNPCRNGGKCQDGAGTYTCKCPSGWAGYNCDTDAGFCRTNMGTCFPSCKSSPCQYGGTCTDHRVFSKVGTPYMKELYRNVATGFTTFELGVSLLSDDLSVYAIYGSKTAKLKLPATLHSKSNITHMGGWGHKVPGTVRMDSYLTIGEGVSEHQLGEFGMKLDQWAQTCHMVRTEHNRKTSTQCTNGIVIDDGAYWNKGPTTGGPKQCTTAPKHWYNKCLTSCFKIAREPVWSDPKQACAWLTTVSKDYLKGQYEHLDLSNPKNSLNGWAAKPGPTATGKAARIYYPTDAGVGTDIYLRFENLGATNGDCPEPLMMNPKGATLDCCNWLLSTVMCGFQSNGRDYSLNIGGSWIGGDKKLIFKKPDGSTATIKKDGTFVGKTAELSFRLSPKGSNANLRVSVAVYSSAADTKPAFSGTLDLQISGKKTSFLGAGGKLGAHAITPTTTVFYKYSKPTAPAPKGILNSCLATCPADVAKGMKVELTDTCERPLGLVPKNPATASGYFPGMACVNNVGNMKYGGTSYGKRKLTRAQCEVACQSNSKCVAMVWLHCCPSHCILFEQCDVKPWAQSGTGLSPGNQQVLWLKPRGKPKTEQGKCPVGYTLWRRACYKFVAKQQTWAQAEATCKRRTQKVPLSRRWQTWHFYLGLTRCTGR